jgi:hypothetical protein
MIDTAEIIVAIAGLALVAGFTLGRSVSLSRRNYIHVIKEIEYLYKRIAEIHPGFHYEKPPAGFGSTREVKEYRVK